MIHPVTALCAFCGNGEESVSNCGRLYTRHNKITAHKKCMQYSSGLAQYTCTTFGGFKVEEVLHERKRGNRLKCFVCKTRKVSSHKMTGATAGCSIRSCTKTFHFTCARQYAVTKRVARKEGSSSPEIHYLTFCGNQHEIEYFDDLRHQKSVTLEFTSDSDENWEEESINDSFEGSSSTNTPYTPTAERIHFIKSKTMWSVCDDDSSHDESVNKDESFFSKAKHGEECIGIRRLTRNQKQMVTAKEVEASRDNYGDVNSLKRSSFSPIATRKHVSPPPFTFRRDGVEKDVKSNSLCNLSIDKENDSIEGADSISGPPTTYLRKTKSRKNHSKIRKVVRASKYKVYNSLAKKMSLPCRKVGRPCKTKSQAISPIPQNYSLAMKRSPPRRKVWPPITVRTRSQEISSISQNYSLARKISLPCRKVGRPPKKKIVDTKNLEIGPILQNDSYNCATNIHAEMSLGKIEIGKVPEKIRKTEATYSKTIKDERNIVNLATKISKPHRNTRRQLHRAVRGTINSTINSTADVKNEGSKLPIFNHNHCAKSHQKSRKNAAEALNKVHVDGNLPETGLIQGTYAVCLVEDQYSSKYDADRIVQLVRREFQLSSHKICQWRYSKSNPNLDSQVMLYLMKDLTIALKDKDFSELYRLLFAMDEKTLEMYQRNIALTEAKPELFQLLHKTLRESIVTNLKQAQTLSADLIGQIVHLDKSAIMLVVLISDDSDPTYKMRHQLGHHLLLHQWTLATHAKDLSMFDMDTQHYYENLEFQNLYKFMRELLRGPYEMYTLPVDDFLRRNLFECTSNKLRKQLKKELKAVTNASTSQPQEVLFVGPVDNCLNIRSYCHVCIPKFLNECLSTSKDAFVLIDSPALSGFHGVMDLYPHPLPLGVTMRVWTAFDPKIAPVTCILAAFTMSSK